MSASDFWLVKYVGPIKIIASGKARRRGKAQSMQVIVLDIFECF